jgi:putative transposase
MRQVARNLTDAYDGFLTGSRYLIHDRDPLFTEEFRAILKDGGVRTVKLPAQSPDLNAFAERLVWSIKEECLPQIIPLGEQHLGRAVTDYTEHYHEDGNHQGLGHELIETPTLKVRSRVQCRERLGGLLQYYYRRAG